VLSGRDLVVFANDWGNDPMSKKHLVRRLARRNRVLWVESLGNRPPRLAARRDLRRLVGKLTACAGDLVRPLRQPEPGIWLLTPLAVPRYGDPIVDRVNRLLVGAQVRSAMRRLGFKRPITYTFVPASVWACGELGEERLVYHCVDDFGAFEGAGRAIVRYEEELCRRADAVIACSQPLFETRRRWNANTCLIRHGVEHHHFARALDPALAEPADLARIPHPRIGFHGLIAEWVDLRLLRRVADAMPDAHIVLIGQANRALGELAGAPNMHHLGRKPYAELPAYCRGLDVAVLPFVPGPLTAASNPLKLREYLSAGLPVVATDIAETRALAPAGIRVAQDDAEFLAHLREALLAPGPDAARSARMAGETWDAKAIEVARVLAGSPLERSARDAQPDEGAGPETPLAGLAS
jgi:glycosyltransferase involved in cell wall biosynthesis